MEGATASADYLLNGHLCVRVIPVAHYFAADHLLGSESLGLNSEHILPKMKRWMIHMCSQPLSSICLKPVGLFPEHWPALARVVGLSVSNRLLGFNGLLFSLLLLLLFATAFSSSGPLSSALPSSTFPLFFQYPIILFYIFFSFPLIPPTQRRVTHPYDWFVDLGHTLNCCQHRHHHPHIQARKKKNKKTKKSESKIILNWKSQALLSFWDTSESEQQLPWWENLVVLLIATSLNICTKMLKNDPNYCFTSAKATMR